MNRTRIDERFAVNLPEDDVVELRNSFSVPVSADTLWATLTDVERIAPCVPGFELLEIAGKDFSGRMKIKVGAITVLYDVTISFVEQDNAERRAVLSVSGRESRGSGSVNATVSTTLAEQGEQTLVDIETDVEVTGKVAQFGRGIIADVSARIVEQFVARLDETILAPNVAPIQPAPVAQHAVLRVASTEVAALDLGAAVLVPMLRRIAPLVVGIVIGRLSVRLLGRKRA